MVTATTNVVGKITSTCELTVTVKLVLPGDTRDVILTTCISIPDIDLGAPLSRGRSLATDNVAPKCDLAEQKKSEIGEIWLLI